MDNAIKIDGKEFIDAIVKVNEVRDILTKVEFNVFGNKFGISTQIDKAKGTRIYLQVKYSDLCRVTNDSQIFSGRKWYLSDYMTTDEVIKTAYAACRAAVEHEIMEGFTVNGVVLFNPHVNYEELLKVSHKEVKRNDVV